MNEKEREDVYAEMLKLLEHSTSTAKILHLAQDRDKLELLEQATDRWVATNHGIEIGWADNLQQAKCEEGVVYHISKEDIEDEDSWTMFECGDAHRRVIHNPDFIREIEIPEHPGIYRFCPECIENTMIGVAPRYDE